MTSKLLDKILDLQVRLCGEEISLPITSSLVHRYLSLKGWTSTPPAQEGLQWFELNGVRLPLPTMRSESVEPRVIAEALMRIGRAEERSVLRLIYDLLVLEESPTP